MRTRVISAIVAIGILLGIVYIGSVAIGIAIFLLAVFGMYEFYKAVENKGIRPVYLFGFISCLPLVYMTFANGTSEAFGGSLFLQAAVIGLFLAMVTLFSLIIFSNGKYTLNDVSVSLFGALYIVFMISFVTLTRKMPNGHLYIWMIFIGAWATDTFAFFTGVTLGKTKIIPKISPKKSLEGSIGGVVGCIAAMLIFGWVFKETLNVPIYHFIIIGMVCGIISQLGDWAASAIKRAVNIKDFGNIMPGHGGVLDRVDSILFVAPAVYFYINLFF